VLRDQQVRRPRPGVQGERCVCGRYTFGNTRR
jgi:hypothetical protein